MKEFFLVLLLISSGLCNDASGQTSGARKNVTLVLVSYECGDFCYLEWKDIHSAQTYSLDNVDEKTMDRGIIQEIQDLYYKNGENDSKLRGRRYQALLEYRNTDEYKPADNGVEGPVKTGRKVKRWMINTLNKLSR